MSFIEGIGDDLLYVFSFLLFLGIISLAWLSTHVNHIQLSTTLFLIERQTYRRNEEDEEEESPTASLNLNSPNEQSLSANVTLTEHESDIELSEIDENDSNINQIQQQSRIHSNELTSNQEEEDQLLSITIKFLNETQKLISANLNDTISKIKRLYFADELANDKIIRFIYQGRELQDSETLRMNNIRDQTVIHCQISTRRHSTPNRLNDRISNANEFDTSSFLDTSPINFPLYILLLLSVILGSIWYLRIKYRVLFTPISTIILILSTIIIFIFACGPLLTTRRDISDTRFENQIQHVHLD